MGCATQSNACGLIPKTLGSDEEYGTLHAQAYNRAHVYKCVSVCVSVSRMGCSADRERGWYKGVWPWRLPVQA